MSRSWSMYLDDMIEAIENVVEFSKEMRDEFFRDKKSRDATLRNLEILGEAAKKIPEDVRGAATEIPWRRIAGLRDLLAHDYFGLDEGILWDVVTNDAPALLLPLKALRSHNLG
ncbi:MAG TPA: DUF86 domain-containing protein [Polyangiaceae bacterium]|nr:DUF86 domain-containing protein [Polyangiaceae bacterium]